MNKPFKFSCPKCGSRSFKTGHVRTSGGYLTSFLNIQYRHFTSVICSECSYTELYNLPLKRLADIIEINKEF